MTTNRAYLDYNATAPLRPECLKLMREIMARPLNASAVHEYGREGRKIVETARRQVAALAGCPPGQLVFNSGATEGNNTVLHHFAGERLLVSAIEHPSVLEFCPEAERIPVTPAGQVDLAALEDMLKRKPRAALVSVMMANNETGVIQPIEEAAGLAKRYGALFHCDAVQAAGRIPIDMAAAGIDFLTLSAHKLGGPQGAGALALGICGITPVLLHGGGQEKKARAGTENVAGIAGFGLAAELALQNVEKYEKLALWRDDIENTIRRDCKSAIVYGADSPRIANTSMVSIRGLGSDALLMGFDLEGVALSNGSACSSGTVRASHVLKAMGAAEELTASALRISLGWATTDADIEIFFRAWAKIRARLEDKIR